MIVDSPVRHRVCVLLVFLSALTALSESNYTLSNCKFISSRKNSTCSTHPVFEKQTGGMKFFPYLRVKVASSVQTYWERMSGVAYYFSSDGSLLAQEEAFPVIRGTKLRAFPDYLQRNKPDSVFFKVPFDGEKKWCAVIAVGDENDKAIATWPKDVNWLEFDFPEKRIVLANAVCRRSDDVNPVDEFAFDTGLHSHPRITFMLRKPESVKSYSDADGLLALCLLANRVEEVKERLQKAAFNDDLTGVLAYAEKRRLAVVGWGAWKYWDPYANWDELDKGVSRGIADAARENSQAWARGMKMLASKYRLPESGYLLCGFSASAQFSIRLAMFMPGLFKAVYAHIPSSFPKPMPLSNKIMWCLTTGEDEVGYERSIAFLEAAQAVGYPIIYKAIPGLGHRANPQADRICEAFFDFAIGYDAKRPPKTRYGDVFRQIVVGEKEKKTRKGIYVPLPTERIASAWKGE